MSFPLSVSEFFELFAVETLKMNINQEQTFVSNKLGEIIATDVGPAFWEVEVQTSLMSLAEGNSLKSIRNSLRGSIYSFYLYDVSQPYPVNDPDGSTYGASTPSVDSKTDASTIDITGLPAGYQITSGEYVEITWGTGRTYLGQWTADKTADGSGDITGATLSPMLPSGVSASDSINLIKPKGLFKIIPGTDLFESIGSVQQRFKFSARQSFEET